MRITDILEKECVRVPLAAEDKIGAITELVDLLHEHGRIADRNAVLSAVIAREKTRSTGIGQGLAVPHGKSAGCPALTMAVGVPTTPIDFSSVDGAPCRVVVLLASPADEMGPHIQALARVSRLWLTETFRSDVAAATSADELYDAIVRHQG